MPFANEHRARLREPADFDPDTFRRTEGGTIFGKIKVPKTISIIWGKLKGHSKPSDYPVVQALAFPVRYWKAEAARAWLKEHKIRVLRFELAQPKKDEGGMPQALRLTATAEINLPSAAEGEQAGPATFTIRGYTGKAMRICGWGLVVLDLETMKAAPSVPALLEHDREQIVGQGTAVSITVKDGVSVSGVVTGDTADRGEAAAKVVGHARGGFRWGASICWDQPAWEEIAAGESVQVNGRTLRGPIRVGRNSLLREVSFVVLGADEDAEARVAAGAEIDLLDEESEMGEDKADQDLTTPAAGAGVEEQVQAAVAADRKRIADITAALDGEGFVEVRQRAVDEGSSLEAAKAAGFDVLTAALKDRDTKLAGAQERIRQLEKVLGSRGVDPSKLTFDASDDAGAKGAGAAGDDGKAATYEARVEVHVKAGLKLGRARMKAAKELPESHVAWIKETGKGQ